MLCALGRAHALLSGFQVKLKVLISLVQVLNGMGFVFSIKYPAIMTNAVDSVSSIFEIDLNSAMPLDCIFPMNYFGKLILRTALPLVVYVLMLIAAKIFRKCNKPWQADALIDGIFFLMFLIYPSTASSSSRRSSAKTSRTAPAV